MFFDTIYIVVGGIDMNDTINEVFSLDFDKVNSYRFDDISNYLRSVKDSFKLETYFITMDDLLAKLENEEYFVDLNVYLNGDTLKTAFPFDDVVKLIKENLNRDITKLSIPEIIIENDISWLEEFKNLSELTISSYNFLSKEKLDYLINNTNIKKLTFKDYFFQFQSLMDLF